MEKKTLDAFPNRKQFRFEINGCDNGNIQNLFLIWSPNHGLFLSLVDTGVKSVLCCTGGANTKERHKYPCYGELPACGLHLAVSQLGLVYDDNSCKPSSLPGTLP